jgi:HEAT repeat protein
VLYLTDCQRLERRRQRIYRFQSPDAASSEIVKQVRTLLAEGFAQRSIDELIGLLSHADRRVRQEAQFALVDKHASTPLARAARESDSQLARLHAIWGLGQLARRKIDHANCLKQVVANLADDPDAEVRAQAAQVLGDIRHDWNTEELRRRLADESPRVRMCSAIALGKLKDTGAIESLLALLEETPIATPSFATLP